MAIRTLCDWMSVSSCYYLGYRQVEAILQMRSAPLETILVFSLSSNWGDPAIDALDECFSWQLSWYSGYHRIGVILQ